MSTPKYTIPAEVHTDCRTAEAKFDAERWFEQASDEDILQLNDCGWGGDLPADEVAEYFSDGKLDPNVVEVFNVLHILRRKDDIGFECHVEEEEAIAWLKKNRPWLHAIIVEQPEEEAYVCIYDMTSILGLKTANFSIEEMLKGLAQKEASQAIPERFNAGSQATCHINTKESKVYIVLHPKGQEDKSSTPAPDPANEGVKALLAEIGGTPQNYDKILAAEDTLGGLVHDIYSEKASSKNNEGIEAQLTFLLENGTTPEEIKKAIADAQ
jgi:hypothetical protein